MCMCVFVQCICGYEKGSVCTIHRILLFCFNNKDEKKKIRKEKDTHENRKKQARNTQMNKEEIRMKKKTLIEN